MMMYASVYIEAVSTVLEQKAKAVHAKVAHLEYTDASAFADNPAAIYSANTIDHVGKVDIPAIVDAAWMEIGHQFASYSKMDHPVVRTATQTYLPVFTNAASHEFSGELQFVLYVQAEHNATLIAKHKDAGTFDSLSKNNQDVATIAKLCTDGVVTPTTIRQGVRAMHHFLLSNSSKKENLDNFMSYTLIRDASSIWGGMKAFGGWMASNATYGLALAGLYLASPLIAPVVKAVEFGCTVVSTVFNFVCARVENVKTFYYASTNAIEKLWKSVSVVIAAIPSKDAATQHLSKMFPSSDQKATTPNRVLPSKMLVLSKAWTHFLLHS
jgi:hypothetical protein